MVSTGCNDWKQWLCKEWWNLGRDFVAATFFDPKVGEDRKKQDFHRKSSGFGPNEDKT